MSNLTETQQLKLEIIKNYAETVLLNNTETLTEDQIALLRIYVEHTEDEIANSKFGIINQEIINYGLSLGDF